MSLERIFIPLLSGGLRDSAADQGGMALTESIELENGFFNTPSSLTIRRGSVDGDRLMDDAGIPAPITSVPFLEFFPDRGKIFVIGHSTNTSKHYIYEVGTDGQNEASPGSDISPIVALPSPYDVANPVLFTGASWFNKTFYVTDVQQLKGMIRFNGDTGVVDQPTFLLGAGPEGPLKPIKVFSHNNHLMILGYGDENMPQAFDLLRTSLPGSPDDFDSADFFGIGDSQEPLTNGLSLGQHGLLFKERRIHRLSGQIAANFAFPEIDKNRGTINSRSAVFYEGMVWFLSEEGFARTGLNGPSELLLDKVKLSFASFDNFQNCWVHVNTPERMVVFACHESGETGTFPNLLVQVDMRTLNWVVRDYLASGGKLFSMAAAKVPQVTGAATGIGPSNPPILTAPTAITNQGWTSNWTEGDTSAGIRTIHESRDKSLTPGFGGPASFAEDGSVDVGTTLLVLTNKNPGATYEERVRHEKNGVFSIFSSVGEIKTLQETPTLEIAGCSFAGVELIISNPNQRGGSNIEIEQNFNGGAFFVVKTIIDAPGAFGTTIPVICGDLLGFRCKSVITNRTGFADSPLSGVDDCTPC